MVLPLLGSFLGSAILPGMFGSLSPLAAGAIGSGLGSLLQGDDLDEAIGTGLTSFMGGKLLGGLGKEFAKEARQKSETSLRKTQTFLHITQSCENIVPVSSTSVGKSRLRRT